MDEDILNRGINMIFFVIYRTPAWDNEYTSMVLSDLKTMYRSYV